jgi:hypothetical protein
MTFEYASKARTSCMHFKSLALTFVGGFAFFAGGGSLPVFLGLPMLLHR